MKPHKVLIADDEIAIQKVMQRLLQSQGYDVKTVSSAAQAEILLDTFEPDLLISDYVMPGEDGLTFLSRLKDSHPLLIRVLLTGFADVRTAVKAINHAHVHYFVVKPFEAEEILQVVADLLAAFPTSVAGAEIGDVGVDIPPDLEAMARLRAAHPGIDAIRRNTAGYILIDDDPDTVTPPVTRDFDLGSDLSLAPDTRARLPSRKQRQREPTYFRNLKAKHPDIDEVRRDDNGYILVDDEDLDAMFDTSEYVRPHAVKKAPESTAPEQGQPPEGWQPLEEWIDRTSDYAGSPNAPRRPDQSEIIFDDALLKLIGT